MATNEAGPTGPGTAQGATSAVTGDEDYATRFSESATLRLLQLESDKTWSKLGVGIMNIIQYIKTGKYVLLMHGKRDKDSDLRLICNQSLTSNLKFLSNQQVDNRAWTWVGHDFSDSNHGKKRTFAVKFKSADLAQKFKDVVDDCQRSLKKCSQVACEEKKHSESTVTDLNVYWSKEMDGESEEKDWTFEIPLLYREVQKYVFRIFCSLTDFFTVMFLVENKDTKDDLRKILSSMGYKFPEVSEEVNIGLGSKVSADPTTISSEIEGAINNVKNTHNIQVLRAKTILTDEDLLDKKCKEMSSEYHRGNISAHLSEGNILLVGRSEEALNELGRKLQEHQYIGQENIEDLTQTASNSSDTKPEVSSLTDSKSGDMKEMIKQTSKGKDILATSAQKNQGNLLLTKYSNNLMGSTSTTSETPPAIATKGARSKKGLDYMLNMIFRSRLHPNSEKDPEFIDYYEYRKWCFLIGNDTQRNLLGDRLQEVNAQIKWHEIDETKGYIEIVLECLDEVRDAIALKEWERKCDEIVQNSYEDLILIVVTSKDIELVQDSLSKEVLITSKTIEMSKPQNDLGVCLLGDGEAMISMISNIQKLSTCSDTIFFDAQTNQEIVFGLVELAYNQCRVWKCLNGEIITKERFPTVKMYIRHHGFSVKLIGNKEDVEKEIEFIEKYLQWISQTASTDETVFEKSVIDFLCHQAVQKFIDNEIRKRFSGTWIIDDDRSSVSYFGFSDESVKKMVRLLYKSFQIKRFHIADKSKLSGDIKDWKRRAKKIEEETDGKFIMHLMSDLGEETEDAPVTLEFLFTQDLLDNPNVNSLLTDITTKQKTESENVEETVEDLLPEVFLYFQKIKKGDLLEVAKAMKVQVDFKEENNIIFFRGNEQDVSFVREYIKKVRQMCILLPESVVLSNIPEQLCNKHQCVFKKMKPNPTSKVWFMPKKTVIVYCGEPRDDLDIDSRAILQIGKMGAKGTTSVSFRKTDKRILTVNLPDMPEGKGMHSAHESFAEAYKQMLAFKGKSLLIPMQNIGNWTVKRFVKGVLYPLINLDTNEVISIVLSDTDPNRCQAANSTLKAANRGSNVKVEILVKKGEIAKEKADVIVNTVAQDLNLSYGAVSSSILKAAKPGIQRELNEKNSFKKNAAYGEMFETDSFGLYCQKVFHGALKSWSAKNNGPRQIMKGFIRKCLEKAHERKFSSMAFPALGTGNLNFPPSEVAEILKEMVEEFEDVHESTSIEKIVFIIYHKDDALFKIFQDALKRENMDENQRPFDIAEEPLQEIMVFGSEADVAQTATELNVCLEAARLKMGKSLKEPDVQEIANRSMTERQGETFNKDNEEKSKAFYTGSTTSPQEKENNQSESRRAELIEADDTKLFLIAKFTDRRKLDENPMLKKMKLQTVVCPYRRENEALLIFKKSEDAEKFMSSNELFREELELQRMERQAVSNVQAQVSNKFLSIFGNLDDLKENVIKNSGVTIQMSKENKWILHGSLPQIELAHSFLRKSYLSTKEALNAPKISEPPGNINAPPSGELKTSLNISKASIGNRSFSGKEGKKDQAEDKDAIQKSVQYKKTTANTGTLVDRTPESFSLPMSEDEYKRFIAVLDPSGETTGGNIRYIDKMLQVSGSKSFIQHIKKQKEEILPEMTVQPIIIPEMDVYDVIKRECKSFSRKSPPVYFLQTDQEKKLEFFGMSQQAVDEAIRSVLDRQEKILEDRKKAVKTSEQGEPKTSFMTNEGLHVEVYSGDITKLNVECIVSSTNKNLQNSHGIAKIIADAAGQDLTRACYDYIREFKSLKEGHCCYTAAGKLKYRFVIHACVSYWSNQNDSRAAKVLKQVVYEALEIADSLKVKSVGLPAICTGQENANKQKCAEMYADAVIEFSLKGRKGQKKCLQEIHFSDKNQETIKVISAVFEEKFKNWAIGAGSALKAEKTPPERPHFLPSYTSSKNLTECRLKLHFKVLIYSGSIIKSNVEAVSCGQDPLLQSKGNIAKNIVGKCKGLKEELQKLPNQSYEIGHTFLMNCTLDHAKKVIFVITESPTGVKNNDYVLRSVKDCYKKVLDFADMNNIKSLAMPLIGTGNKGAPKHTVARLWFESVLEFLDSTGVSNLRELHFVSTDANSAGTIASLLSNYTDQLETTV